MRPSALVLLTSMAAVGCRGGGDKAQLPEQQPTPQQAHTTAGSSSSLPAAGNSAAGSERDPPSNESAHAAWTGTTEPHRRGTLTPRVSGVVTRVHVREGDVVRRGDPLVSLDLEDFTLRLRQAEAGLQVARVQHDAARVEWERNKALLADRTIPQAQFDAVNARFEGAKAALAQAEVAVDMARKALRDAVIRAPYDALVARRLVSEGEYATTMPATQLVTIEEIAILDLRVQVPATDMQRVQVGAVLQIRFAGVDREVRAAVTRVVGSVDPRTRTFPVIAELPNPEGALRPGLFAHVSLAGAANPPATPSTTDGRP